MARFAQVGIALGTLGIVLALMGLFPGVTGIEPTLGIGLVQVFLLLLGYALLIFGALIYVKYTFYINQSANLAQQIGIRFALTGLVFAGLAGLADILGFGTHLRTEVTDIFFGPLQAVGILGNFALSSVGVLLYAVAGNPVSSDDLGKPHDDDEDDAPDEHPAP